MKCRNALSHVVFLNVEHVNGNKSLRIKACEEMK